MTLIVVSLRDARLFRYQRALAQAPGRARMEMARGLNEGGNLVRTKVRRALREQTGILRYGTIVARTKSIGATPARLEYVIRGIGPGVEIEEVRTSVRTGPGGGVYGEPWRVGRQFKRSFRQLRRGKLMARLGAERFPIRRLRGPNLMFETVEGQSLETFEHAATQDVMRAMTRRLARMLPTP